MPIIKIINGDLLEATEPYIAQQCNCCTVKAHGLSASIATRFPWANVYKRRKSIGKGRNNAVIKSMPGTIEIDSKPETILDHLVGPTTTKFKIIHMFAQYCPGKPNAFSRYYDDTPDSFKDRKKYFKKCLDLIDKDPNITVVEIPYLIGCGLAGGSWKDYEKMLDDSKTDIVLYKI
jgi:hypothetical protein